MAAAIPVAEQREQREQAVMEDEEGEKLSSRQVKLSRISAEDLIGGTSWPGAWHGGQEDRCRGAETRSMFGLLHSARVER